MPSINETKNLEHRQANYNRRSRAYNYLKAVALREGWMAHERDTAGFDEFMDSLEKSGVISTSDSL